MKMLLTIKIVLLFFMVHSMLYFLKLSNRLLSLLLSLFVGTVYGFAQYVLASYLQPMTIEGSVAPALLGFLIFFMAISACLGFIFGILFIFKIRLPKFITLCTFFVFSLMFFLLLISDALKLTPAKY